MWLTRLSINNPYFAAVLVLATVVLGFFSIFKLPVEAFPDVRFPVAMVSTTYEGASPEVVESDVSKPIEEALNTINGIKNIRSYSFEGSSVVIAEFELDVDTAKSVQDVRDKVGAVGGTFDRDIDTPVVSEFNPMDESMLSIAMGTDKVSLRELTDWTDNTLKKRLQTVMGVGEVEIVGGTERQITVAVKPDQLRSLNVNIADVNNAIAAANSDYPSGTVRQQGNEIAIRVTGKIKHPESFANIVVANREGSLIRVRDVADVKDDIAEATSIATLNGKPAVSLNIRATRGANVVEVADGVKAMLDEEIKRGPPDLKVVYTYDQSDDIRNSVNEVRDTLIEGVLLTVLIVFLFLGTWRSTVITGLTLPVSLIGAMWAISLMGFTINLMTLMALSLAIGLLIDDAIVVRENIVRHVQLGKSHFQAALDGTQEIGLAVLATTLCIVAVFLPIGYMDGIIGKFFHQFGLTVAAAMVISTVVSLSLDPMLSSIWHDPKPAKRSMIGRAVDRFDRWIDEVAERYTGWVRWCLHHPIKVLAVVTVMMLGSFALVGSGMVGGEFMPQQDRGKIKVAFKTATGSTLEYTTQKTSEVRDAIGHFPEVKSVAADVGAAGFGNGKTNSSLSIDVGDKNERERDVHQLMKDMRVELDKIAGIEITSIEAMGQAGPGGKIVNVGLRGSNSEELTAAAKQVEAAMAKIPGVTDIENSESDADPSLDVLIDRDAASALGINLATLGDTLKTLYAGSKSSSWEAPDGNSYDVQLRIPQDARTAELLKQTTIPATGSDGQVHMVSLDSIATIKPGISPRQINRINLQREISLTANIAAGYNNSEVFSQIDAFKSELHLPNSVTLVQEGASKDMQESGLYALQALALGIIFIYLILVAQFRSFTLPITIMMSLPLIFIGVFVALWLTGNTLNMFSIIGIVMLMGLSAKNGILLVDFINHARLNVGMDRLEAIIEAGKVRLRPIVMTSLAMIFGMLPLALGNGEGSETRQAMAYAIIGGLITSTMLTLIVVPIVYVYLDNIRGWIHKTLKRINHHDGGENPSAS